MPMFIVLSSWQGHCKSSLGSFDECRLSDKRPPTLRPSQPTWAVSLPVRCHHVHPLLQFIIITQPGSWHLFYLPTEGRRLSWPRWLDTYQDGLSSRSTHPSTNWAWRRATALIETDTLPLYHATTIIMSLLFYRHTGYYMQYFCFTNLSSYHSHLLSPSETVQ